MPRLGWQLLLALGLSLALMVALGYVTASGPSGEFGNLGVVFIGLLLIAATVVLAAAAFVVAIWQRGPEEALLVIAFAAGLFPGFIGGVRLYDAFCCLNVPPDPVRTVALTLSMTVGEPYSLTLEGMGECTIDTSSEEPPMGLSGRVFDEDTNLEIELFGLPATEISPDSLDSFDVTFFDGQPPAWGYRPTHPAQVRVTRVNRLQGTTRLVDLPLLEDTRPPAPDDRAADSMDADIDWLCDPQSLL